MNGLLDVEARIEDTGEKFQTYLTHNVENLTERQIERAKQRLQALKFYPRDELCHQRLMRFAERVVGEVNPWQREGLDETIDRFERSLLGTDRAQFQIARDLLIEKLSAVGRPYVEETS